MQEVEVPLEHLHEEIHHRAEHGGEKWISAVALSTAVLAALAAVTAMLGGHYANDAMIDRIESSDQWNYYQAKGIKREVYANKIDLLEKEGKKPDAKDLEKVKKYKADQAGIFKIASERSHNSKIYLETHIRLSYATTLFQVAITIAAIAVLTKRIWFWYFGMVCGVVGTALFIHAMVVTPQIEEPKEELSFLNRPAIVRQW